MNPLSATVPAGPRARVALTALAVCMVVAGSSPAHGQRAGDTLTCDISEVSPRPDARARMSGGILSLEWAGSDDQRVSLRLGLEEGAPIVRELALLRGQGSDWTVLATDAMVEYRIVEGYRRISNQQLEPLRELGVPLTSEVVDRYKWDVFWDAPLDLRTDPGSGAFGSRNPPPPEGVAHQPGLPRDPSEVRRATATFTGTTCRVASDGRRLSATFDGLRLGSFTGALVFTVWEGTNLIRTEAVGSTDLPSVAYKYDVGLTGLRAGPDSRVVWRDVSNLPQAYSPLGPANDDPVVLRAANRLVVAETGEASVAAFPPPHTFFWAREVEINVGNNWYRKDADGTFAVGIRQGEQEVVERYMANWSLYSAPPGTEQRMAAFFFPTLGDADAASEGALAFTRSDRYAHLNGYQVMGSHYHTDLGRNLIASGSLDTRLPDFDALRAAGLQIVGPVDRPREETQLEEQHALFEGARRNSDDAFVVMPQMENSNLLGGHWDLLFSHPVYYVDERAPGTPLITEHPEYGRMYNIGDVEDMMRMVENEDMLVFMPHPRTKGSTGYPDAVRETQQFLNDRYRGVGWRWGMGSDLSEDRLSGKRVIPLFDEMNNWMAQAGERPKYLLGITETYRKAPGDDIYANGPVTYLRMDRLPPPGEYAPIVEALDRGDYFVTSGEVLIPRHRYEGSGSDMQVVADVEWTFPLAFVELVFGDGEVVTTRRVSGTDFEAFGTRTFTIPFDGTRQRWVRFAAWDEAGNGAMTMPIALRSGGR